jgi:hypothetical protein
MCPSRQAELAAIVAPTASPVRRLLGRRHQHLSRPQWSASQESPWSSPPNAAASLSERRVVASLSEHRAAASLSQRRAVASLFEHHSQPRPPSTAVYRQCRRFLYGKSPRWVLPSPSTARAPPCARRNCHLTIRFALPAGLRGPTGVIEATGQAPLAAEAAVHRRLCRCRSAAGETPRRRRSLPR